MICASDTYFRRLLRIAYVCLSMLLSSLNKNDVTLAHFLLSEKKTENNYSASTLAP